jgi:uracil-DNA glycosylase family 4
MKPDTDSGLAQVLENVSEWLRYAREIGIEGVLLSRRSPAEPGPPVPRTAVATLDDVRASLEGCKRCRLGSGRTTLVFGTGNARARLMFVGEAPGRDEDLQGEPFVGKAGQLLTRIIEAMGLKREEVYIANIVKCRPPENRNPERDEIESCVGFLRRQIAIIRPEVICALGTVSAQTLLGVSEPITKLRGRFFDLDGVKVMPTFHPSYLLRNPEKKKEVWEDVRKIMAFLKQPPPEKA